MNTTTNTVVLALSSTTPSPSQSSSSSYSRRSRRPRPPKILVLGSSGLVGTEVVQQLKTLGIPHIAPTKQDVDLLDTDAKEKLAKLLSNDCTAIISCVGSLNDPQDYEINASSGMVAQVSQAARAKQQTGTTTVDDDDDLRFVFISNDPRIRDLTRNLPMMKNYIKGKEVSEEQIRACFPNTYTFICPTLIHGGEELTLQPAPRIPSTIGKPVEGFLGLYPFQAASDALPSVVGVALAPPISHKRVASACINAALGLCGNSGSGRSLDTREAILRAASKRPSKRIILGRDRYSDNSDSSTSTTSTSQRANDLKQQLYALGDCGGDDDKLQQAFKLLEQIEECNIRNPTTDPTLNGRWDFVLDVEADIGTGLVKEIMMSSSEKKQSSPPILQMVLKLKDLYMQITDNSMVDIFVNAEVFNSIPMKIQLTTKLRKEPDDGNDDDSDNGTTFLEQFEGIKLNGRQFLVPDAWQRSRPLEFSYLDDDMLIARGNGEEPHYLKRTTST